MKWKRIRKEASVQPASGIYSDWKPYIANEAENRCVYCAIHDAFLGGLRNFHVEHYRPKSIERFSSLENSIENLYYSCPICNTFKSNDWPNDPNDDHSIQCYPDPSKYDYCDLFEVNIETGLISGKYVATKYIVEKLFLNRGQLILDRKTEILYEKLRKNLVVLRSLRDRLQRQDINKDIMDFFQRYMDLSEKIMYLQASIFDIEYYKTEDVKKSSKK